MPISRIENILLEVEPTIEINPKIIPNKRQMVSFGQQEKINVNFEIPINKDFYLTTESTLNGWILIIAKTGDMKQLLLPNKLHSSCHLLREKLIFPTLRPYLRLNTNQLSFFTVIEIAASNFPPILPAESTKLILNDSEELRIASLLSEHNFRWGTVVMQGMN